MPLPPIDPIHPGEILREEFLVPLGITPYRLAKALNVSHPTINDVVCGKRSISTRMAHRLGKYFGTTALFWLGLQRAYNMHVCEMDAEFMATVAAIRPLKGAD